ncbi:MAG: DNA recombination protein RmuC [Alphaproteobacteria bacterium]
MNLDFGTFAVGIALGALVAWLAMRARIMVLQNQLIADEERQTQDDRRFKQIASAALQESQDALMRAASTQFGQAHNAMLQSSTQNIETLLRPMHQQVTNLSQQVQELEVKREGAYQQLLQNIAHNQQIQEQLRKETSDLARLMKHPAERGRWSDVQLQNIFRLSGMEAHVGDFEAQATIPLEQGGVLRPDYVLRLPGGKHIVIDVKSPFDHYYRAETAEDPAQIDIALRDHAGSLREHVRALGKKDYGRAMPGSPEFTVMFIPAEHLVTAALRVDKDLIQHALESRVVIATPTTLFALLSALAYGWQQANVAENARKIAVLGKELYESFGPFVDHWQKLGGSLGKAVQSYNDTVGSLQSRILAKVRTMKTLGVSVSEDLPDVAPIAAEPRGIHIPELTERDAGEAAE